MADSSGNAEERKDCFYLESLALPGEIQSMVVGRFFDKNIESLVLAKSTFLSVFHNNEEEDSIDFVDHICVYKEVYCLCASVQPHSLDCLFVLSIGGEWLLLQWNKTRFFPLASGSLLKAIQPLMKTPEQRRFRLDPTFQWAVSVVPITDNSPRFFTRPASQTDEQQDSWTTKPIVRISFRAVIVVDETVFVGAKYDGPDANFLSVIKNNWQSALKQFPGKFGFFNADNKEGFKKENVNTLIRNGLENEWKVLQSVEQSKQDLCIANADTFIFFEDDDDQPNFISNKFHSKDHKESLRKKKSISLFESINVIRHLTFTTAMQLEPFPIRKKPYIMHTFPFAAPLGRERDGEVAGPGLNQMERSGRIQLPENISSKDQPFNNKHNLTEEIKYEQTQKTKSEIDESNLSYVTAIALIDQPAAISVYSLLFDFDHHLISLHSFVLTALPSSSSRLMSVLDENWVMKTLKGENIKLINRMDVGNVNIVKGAFAKMNEYVKEFYCQENQYQEYDKESIMSSEDGSTNTPRSQISVSQYSNSNTSLINQSKSNLYHEATNRLHKHLASQVFKVNAFIITFPNKIKHKLKFKQQNQNKNSSEHEYQVLSTSNTDSNDNIEDLHLTLDQQQINDNSKSLNSSNQIQEISTEQYQNKPIPNFHPFMVIASFGVGLFTSHLTQLNFIFPIPFPQPPMSILYYGGKNQDCIKASSKSHKSNHQTDSKITHKQKHHRDIKSVDKLFIASGNSLVIIANGQIQSHTYPFKWFNELAMTNGANWFISSNQKKSCNQQSSQLEKVSSQQSLDNQTHSSSSDLLDYINYNSDLNNIQLKIGTSMLFIISSSNSSLIVDMSTGAFYEFPVKETKLKELGEGEPEDFQCFPMSVNAVVPIPYYSFSHHHSIEDRFVLGVGNGRSGALHNIGLGRRLQTIMQGKWYEELPTLFTSRAYAGSPLHSLLLVEEEKIIEINNEQSEKNKDDNKRMNFQKKQSLYPNKHSSLLKDGGNLYNIYYSSIFTLHEDVVQPVDSKDIGIDNLKKTLTLGSANGAVVQVTTSDIHVIPTLRFFAHQSNQDEQSQQQGSNTLSTIINPQSQQQIPKNIYQKGLIIRSEFIGYNAQHAILWQAPTLLSEEFCQQRISDFQQKHSNMNSQKSQIVQSEQISSFQYAEQSQQLAFECACVTDNMIAVSYKCIVFVLVWNPSRPQITSNSSNPAKSSNNQSSISQIPAILHPVSTLCFPSPVKTLTASTICSRSFLVVGCESPSSVFLFRLDTPQIAQQTINSHNKLWDEGEKLLNNLKYQIAYPTVLRPDPTLIIINGIKSESNVNENQNKHSIRLGEGNQCSILQSSSFENSEKQQRNEVFTNKQIRFVEVMCGSHQFVEVYYSSNVVMTRLFDLFPYDRLEQIILTTFNNQMHFYTQEEKQSNILFYNNSNDNHSFHKQTSPTHLSSENDILNDHQQYMQNDGAVLIIAGHNGQLATAITPLSAILDFPPTEYDQKSQHCSSQFFFPSLITSIRLYPQTVWMAEDDGIIYIYGDRAYALTWSNNACKFMWTDLEYPSIIHSFVPMRVVDEQPSLQFLQDDNSNKENDKIDLEKQSFNANTEDTPKTQIPHPTVAWIDFTDQKLTFGTIDKRRIITRQIKDLPSLPLAVAHVPTMHAIAVLCREHSNYPYYEQTQEYNNNVNQNEKFQMSHKENNKNSSQNVQLINNTKSSSLTGLGLDVSGISSLDQQMYMPYHDIFITYLKFKGKIRSSEEQQTQSQISPSSFSPNIEQINNETMEQKIKQNKYQLSGQFFHESIPERDYKGDPFIDIATDWFIESHSKHFKDYRPKRLPPYRYNAQKINLCYSSQTNFTFGYPTYLYPPNVISAIKNRSVRLNAMKKESVYIANNELYVVKDQNIENINKQKDIQINEQLPLPSINHPNLNISLPSTQSNSSSQETLLTQKQNANENRIEFTANSFEQFVKTVTNSFVIILYDETEMHLRIGQLNLSNLNLDFGKNQNELNNLSSNQQIRNNEPLTVEDYYKLDNFAITTQLYNFFSMVCVSIPTQKGFQESMKVQRSTINELEEASNELNYDKKSINNINKLFEEIEESNIKNDLILIQQTLKLQESFDGQKFNKQIESNQNIGNYQIENNILDTQIKPKNIESGNFDENEYLNRKRVLTQQYKENNKNREINTELLKAMHSGEFSERFARSLICVLGRESTFGSQRIDMPLIGENQNSQSQQKQITDLENETFYESMITDIFTFEVERHYTLGNARNTARQLLEKQLSKNNEDKVGNNDNHIHFNDEQIQSALDDCETIPHSYGDLSTSPMTTVYDRMQNLNVSLTLHKRIRIIGGVQGIYGFPSTLVVLNGRGAFIFFIGPRIDDQELSTISKIYNLNSYNQLIQQQQQHQQQQLKKLKNDEKQIDNDLQLIHPTNENMNKYSNLQYCSCTNPMFSEIGELFPSTPFHASITNVNNRNDSKGQLKIKPILSLPKMRQFFTYGNDVTAIPYQAMDSYIVSSPLTFNIVQVALIIAPSPITCFTLLKMQSRPTVAPLPRQVLSGSIYNDLGNFRGLTLDHKLSNIIPSYMQTPQTLRALLIFSPCGFAFLNIQSNKSFQLNYLTLIQKRRLCAYNPKDGELVEDMINKSKQILNSKNQKQKNQKKKLKKDLLLTNKQKLYIPPSMQVFYKKQDQDMIVLPNTSIMPLCFAQPKCRQCNRVFRISYNNKSQQQITNSFSENSIQNNLNCHSNINQVEQLIDQIETPQKASNVTELEQLENQKQYKSSIPPINSSNLAAAAGIFLKHRPNDLVRTAAAFGQKTRLLAQAYAPTLIVDSAQLGINQFGIVGDQQVLIYALLPNPLYKRMKKQTNQNKGYIRDKDEYEYLPMCAVLNARISTICHFSFIQRCNLGANSIFGEIRNSFFRKMLNNLETLKSQKFSLTSLIDQKQINNLKTNIQQQTIKNEKVDNNSIIKHVEETEDELYAEDFDDESYLPEIKSTQTFMELMNFTSKNAMQRLPAIPSFIIFSRSGKIMRAIPTVYDKFPIKDIFITIHILAMLEMNFGDIWKHQQKKIFEDFNDIEVKTFRITIIEQALREWIATGRIARIPPVPLSDFLPNIYGMRNGRYISSYDVFGLSPKPINTEATYFKTLSYQNVITTIKILTYYVRTMNQRRLIIREVLRRFIKNFQNLNLQNRKTEEIQNFSLETLLKKEVYAIMNMIVKPFDIIIKDDTNKVVQNIEYLLKQSRIGMKLLNVALKCSKSGFIKRVKEEFQHSLNRERFLEYQLWFKYGNEIMNEPLGIYSSIDMSFKDDPTVDGIYPQGLISNSIKLSKQFNRNSSEYSLDLLRISEKMNYNKLKLTFAGLNFNLNSLYKPLIKENKNIFMISKSKELYHLLQHNIVEEVTISEDDVTFITQFPQNQFPVYLTQTQQQQSRITDINSDLQSQKNQETSELNSFNTQILNKSIQPHQSNLQTISSFPVQTPQIQQEHIHNNKEDINIFKKYQKEQIQNIDNEYESINKREKVKVNNRKRDKKLNKHEKEKNFKTIIDKETEKLKDKKHRIKKKKDMEQNEENNNHSLSQQANVINIDDQVQNIAHPLKQFELPLVDEFDFDIYQPNFIFQQTEINQDIGIIFSDNNKREDNLLNLQETQQPQLQQLQRAQFNVHFPHFNQTQKDIDWGENIGIISSQDSKMKDDAKVENNFAYIQSSFQNPSSIQNRTENSSLIQQPQNFTLSTLLNTTLPEINQTSSKFIQPPSSFHSVEQVFELPNQPVNLNINQFYIPYNTPIQLNQKYQSSQVVQSRYSRPGAIPLYATVVTDDSSGEELTSDIQSDKDQFLYLNTNNINQLNQL